MNPFYVYRHIRLDTNIPFYVGKGKGNRAFSIKNRNLYWHNTSKSGYKVDIVFKDLSEVDAFDWEKKLILIYKKFNLCKCNLTTGGEGTSGVIYSPERRQTISTRVAGTGNPMYGRPSAMTGKKHTLETREKISIKNVGRTYPPFSEDRKYKISQRHLGNTYNLGKTPSLETREKLRIATSNRYLNKVNPLIGRITSAEVRLKQSLNSSRNQKIINIESGEIYPNIRTAAESINISKNQLKSYLNGRLRNKTALRKFYEHTL